MLAMDRAALRAELAGMADLRAQQEDRILLSVGGTPFEASRRTLTAEPASFLGAMFSGRHELRVDPDGRIFIDRSGTLFPHVLDFLRSHADGDENAALAIQVLPEAQREAVRREVNYFGLEEVIFPVAPFSLEEARFEPGPAMGTRRYGCAAVALYGGGEGRRGVLVVGGWDGSSNLSSTEVLDVDSGLWTTWSAGSAMASRRQTCAAAVLENGRVVVVGGSNSGGRLSTTEVLDAAGSAWSPGPQLASRRSKCAAVALAGNRPAIESSSSADGAAPPGCPRRRWWTWRAKRRRWARHWPRDVVTARLFHSEMVEFSSSAGTTGPLACRRRRCWIWRVGRRRRGRSWPRDACTARPRCFETAASSSSVGGAT
jgi:hypothetical protein